jgi:hypothetical protein
MLRKDLDAAIALPPRDEWRPSRARADARTQHRFLLAVAAGVLLIVVLFIAGQLATRSDQQRLPPASPPAPTPAAGVVQLTIKSATTGLPIHGAVVSAYYDEPNCCHFYPRLGMNATWPDRGLVVSDSAGAYSMTLANGRYKLYIWVPLSIRPGDPAPQGTAAQAAFHPVTTAYAPQWLGGADYRSARVVDVTGKDLPAIEAQMSPGHVISGVITNRGGKRVAMTVDVFAGGSAECCTWVDAGYSQFTNEDDACVRFPQPGTQNPCRNTIGEYRIAVANGVYKVRASTANTAEANVSPAQAWWTDAQDFDRAKDVVVRDADVSGVDIVVPLGP